MPVYSHSRISTFENCPLQYRYRYIDRIRMDVQGIEAFMGKLVHEVLEDLYTDLDRARSSTASDYVAMFDERWEQRWSPSIRIVREKMTPEHYRETGRRCVRTCFTQNEPFDSGEVLGCETRVEFALDGERRYRMLGFIDRVDRVGDDAIEIHDYKTGSLPRAGALRKDRQLTLYEIALRERYADVGEVRHVWHYLAHGKRFEERRRAEDLKRTRLATIRAIQEIEATAEFPARRSPLCSWCDYQGICPEWAGEPESDPAPPELEPGTDQYRLFGGPASR